MREIRRFLHESWQLFYWSLFLPSKVQQRVNEWLSDEATEEPIKDIWSSIILLLTHSNPRFILQYLLVVATMSLPLAILVGQSGRGWDWLLLLSAPASGYGLGLLFLPSGIGFCTPLLLVLIYWQQPELFTKAFQMLPTLPQLLAGLGISIIGVVISIFFSFWIIIAQNARSIAHYALWIGCLLSVLLGSWIATHNFLITLFLLLLTSISALSSKTIMMNFENDNSGDDNSQYNRGCATSFVMFLVGINVESIVVFFTAGGVAVFPTSIVAFFVDLIVVISVLSFAGVIPLVGVVSFARDIMTFFVAVLVTFFAAGLVAGVAISPLPWFLVAAALLAFSLAPLPQRWLGVWISAVLVALGWEKLGFNTLWAIPVVLMFYYRVFPNYLVASLSSLAFTLPLLKRFMPKPDRLITKLPPYTTELLWLPLPNHAQILADTFRENPAVGLHSFQKMQAISLPGFQSTIQTALPSIVADRLAAVSTTSELIDSVTPTHPFLPLLIPSFYQFDEIDQSLAPPKSGNTEIDTLFPILKQIAQDTAAALQASSSALRERGLERLVDKLKILPAQLPGLGLNPRAVQSWQPAIQRWQEILEREITEQQKISQSELLNPFQFGNPLRSNHSTIFKGRQDFADRLVRQILDRNRPTLVLHGPRRAGKTSFLLNLPRLLPSDLVPIYLDMQQASMTDSEGDFCYGLVRAIERDTRSQGIKLPPRPSREDFRTRPYPTLEDWLEDVLSQLGERRLLLNLDEFEKIGTAIEKNRISERLFDELRSMIQHYDRLGFLFSGVQTLEELGPRWSNYFISIVPMEMHYLQPHEAEDLLLNPDPEFELGYADGVVAEILRLTRCQPYLLQLIGSAIVTQANLNHTRIATTELLTPAIQDAFTNGEPYFTNIWTEFTGTKPSEVAAGQQILMGLAQGHSPSGTDEITTAARRRLLRYHIIEHRGDIDRIEIPLFEQWVTERAIV